MDMNILTHGRAIIISVIGAYLIIIIVVVVVVIIVTIITIVIIGVASIGTCRRTF